MRNIWAYIKNFYTDHLNKYDLLFALLFTIIFTYFNYINPIISTLKNKLVWENELVYFYLVLYAVPFFLAYLFQSLNHKTWDYWRKPGFWFLCLFAIAVFTLRSTSHLFSVSIWEALYQLKHSMWYYSIITSCMRSMLVILPIVIYWLIADRRKMPLYGFSLKGFNTRPYFVMLLIMLPLIIIASTQSDFLGTYPRGAKFTDLSISNPDHFWHYVLYELIYGADFISIEFFFRGFLILGFVSVAGPRVLIPMAILYVVIHHGKPAGELVSSLFGGCLLGIIAYYSKSIIGGIIVHVGIAWMMELGALIGNLYAP